MYIYIYYIYVIHNERYMPWAMLASGVATLEYNRMLYALSSACVILYAPIMDIISLGVATLEYMVIYHEYINYLLCIKHIIYTIYILYVLYLLYIYIKYIICITYTVYII